jgi:lysophospholipase L1-like esterase
MATRSIEGRLREVEKAMEAYTEKMERLDEYFRLVNELGGKVSALEGKLCECKGKRVIVDGLEAAGGMEMIEKVGSTVLDRITACQLDFDEKLKLAVGKVDDIASRAEAIRLELQDRKGNWPIPGEGGEAGRPQVSEISNRTSESKPKVNGSKTSFRPGVMLSESSFGRKLQKTENTGLLLGDSLARGVGDKLELHCGRNFSKKSRSGATIETIEEEVGKLKDCDKRHLIILTGTNNLEKDESSEIIEKYDKMIEKVKKVQNRRVTVIGIVKRYDLKPYYDRKRIVINMRLRERCVANNIDFVTYEPERTKLANDSLHLNTFGQEELAKMIFRNFVTFL